MHRTLFLTSAALAQLVIGQHAQEHQHNRIHAGRDVVWQIDTAYETVVVTQYVTAGQGPPHSHYAPPAETTTTTVDTPTTSSVYSPPPPPPSSSAPPFSSSSTSVAPVETPSSTYVAPVETPSSTYVAPVETPSSTYVAPASTSVAEAKPYSPPASSAPVPTTFITSSTSSSTAAPSSSSAAGGSGISTSNLTPNGKKAGLSGYIGIQKKQAFSDLAPYISWYSDYTAVTPSTNGVKGVGMLWGASGSPCGSFVTERLAGFQSLASASVPDIMFGFYEPDCTCTMSSDMSTSVAATQWDALIAPLKAKGTVLGSPSMCKQYDEDFLTPFKAAISVPWDVTSVHINKPNIDEVKKTVEYYVNKYQKPVWVSEFSCVNDQPGWSPCTDQTQINSLIQDAVAYFESNDNVVAYGPSNGEGLGDVWPLTDSNGDLTTSGMTYLNAIKSL